MITPELRTKVYIRDGMKCVVCGAKQRLSLDHILPINKGGGDTEDNLQTMCIDCNWKKGDHYLNFLQRMFPFQTIRKSELLYNEIKGMIASINTTMRKEISLTTNQQIDSKINNFKQKHQYAFDKKEVVIPPPVVIDELGLKNTVTAFSNRSKERDDRLLKIIYLLCTKVEELEKQINKNV